MSISWTDLATSGLWKVISNNLWFSSLYDSLQLRTSPVQLLASAVPTENLGQVPIRLLNNFTISCRLTELAIRIVDSRVGRYDAHLIEVHSRLSQ